MAITCPAGLDPHQLRAEVQEFYARFAEDPRGEVHFHRGREYAASFLGYDADELRELPRTATASFAGVGRPLCMDAVSPGETVVDVGSGTGTDLLLAAKRVGTTGRVIGVDMTAQMRRRAMDAADEAGLSAIIDVVDGDAESLPLDDGFATVVMSNGVLNLTTDKRRAFSEFHRVLQPGGRLLLADIVIETEIPEEDRQNIDLWTA